MNDLDYLKLEAVKLDIGDSCTVYCPFCRAEHENKLSISRSADGILYNCFRNSCNAHGFIPSTHWAVNAAFTQRPKERKFKQFTEPTFSPSWHQIGYLSDTYRICEQYVARARWKFTEDGRIVMPVLNAMGFRTGITTKRTGAYTNDKRPKAMHYPINETSLPFMHFDQTYTPNTDKVYLVEDMLSAARVNQCGYLAVALLGTQMSAERITVLRKAGIRRVGILLDNDAATTAYKMKDKWGGAFDDCVVTVPLKDPKDMAIDELRNTLYG